MTIVYQTVTAGDSYSRTITASNTIYFAAENLPTGLSISSSGVISGILQQAGRFAITILARGVGGTSAAILDLTVNTPPTPFITSVDAVTHEMATAFSYQITASSPTAILSYGATNLPTGLSVDTGTGLITGTPTSVSNNAIVTVITTLSAVNANGTGYQYLTFTLQQRPVITSSLTSLNYFSGFPITPYTITASKSPTSFNAVPLPSGLSIDTSTGIISGTPVIPAGSTPVSTSIGLSADNGYLTGNATLNVTVGIVPTITSSISKTSEMGTVFSYQITASSPTAILSYGASGLPTGLSVNTSTGLISGTPTSASNDAVVTAVIGVSATNSYGSGQQNVTLSLQQRPVITSSLTPILLAPYSPMSPYTITATKSPVVFGASPLPPGLSVDQITGVISGSPAIPLVAPGASGYANSSTKQNVRFNDTSDIVVTSNGTYITDRNNFVVRKYVNEASGATLFAGSPGVSGTQDGTGAAARFTDLKSITADSSGNIYVLDNCAVRKITPSGVVTTFAGNVLDSGFVNAVGTAARFYLPGSIRFVNGTIVISDLNRILQPGFPPSYKERSYLRSINISTAAVSTLFLVNTNLAVLDNGATAPLDAHHIICSQLGVTSSSIYFGYALFSYLSVGFPNNDGLSSNSYYGVARYSFATGTVTNYYLTGRSSNYAPYPNYPGYSPARASDTRYTYFYGSPIFLGSGETNGICKAKITTPTGPFTYTEFYRVVSFTGNAFNFSDDFVGQWYISGSDGSVDNAYIAYCQGLFCYNNNSQSFNSADYNCLTSISNTSGNWVRTLVSGSQGGYPATSTNSTLSANNGALIGTATLNIQTSQAYP